MQVSLILECGLEHFFSLVPREKKCSRFTRESVTLASEKNCLFSAEHVIFFNELTFLLKSEKMMGDCLVNQKNQ